MLALIIFCFMFIISNTSYIGGDILYALSYLLWWYVLVSIPLIFVFLTQTWAYISVVKNTSCIKDDPSINMTKYKAITYIYKTYNDSFGTLISILLLHFIKCVLTVACIYLISPTALVIGDLSKPAISCFILLMSINVYHCIKGIKSYF